MKSGKLILILAIGLIIAAVAYWDLTRFLSFEALQAQRDTIQAFYADNQALTLGLYFLMYVVVTALAIPGAVIMTLAGGALFGLWTGLLIISFASTIGATLAFLIARFLLRDWVQDRFGRNLKAFNKGIEKEGAFYLFTLRLIPAFPFFMINSLMGLTPMRTWTYYWVSQLGMLAGTFVYVNAGTQLGQLEGLSGILSPTLIASFALLGLFPLIAKKTLDALKARKVYAGVSKPKTFDRNLVVIGAGSGGLVSAYIAAAVKAKVSLIEKHKMGGDCLNTGCVPSKALIRSARFLHDSRRAQELGFKQAHVDYDFAEVMARVSDKVKAIEPHDSVERYTDLGVDVIQGEAEVIDPYHVKVHDITLSTRNIIIATGASPIVPDLPGLEEADVLTSENVWEIRERPQRLIVIGGGPIGCELTQAFQRLDCQVTQLVRGERLMKKEDADVSAIIADTFRREGVDVRFQSRAVAVQNQGDERVLSIDHMGQSYDLAFDKILFAIGRKANVEGVGLDGLNLEQDKDGTLSVNDALQTKYPNIYACGDVAGPYQFTHTAAHQAWYAAVNALFRGFKRFRVDYSVIPWATFTDPEVARVGLNEQEAQAEGIAYEVSSYDIDDLDRAIVDSADKGLVKVLTVPGKDKILGATIVGDHAGELITEFVSAMKHGVGLNKILGTIHIYPTYSESNKYTAGVWKKAHAPQGLLQWVERFHNWRRNT